MFFLGNLAGDTILEVRPFEDLATFFTQVADNKDFKVKDLNPQDGGMLCELTIEGGFPFRFVRWDEKQFKKSKKYKGYLENVKHGIKKATDYLNEQVKVLEVLNETL